MCENVITVLSIVISGIISWIISYVFFNKTNRCNLEITIIIPITELINKAPSKENAHSVERKSQEFCNRFLKKKEEKSLKRLVETYKAIQIYDTEELYGLVLYDYFFYRLDQNGITYKGTMYNFEYDECEEDLFIPPEITQLQKIIYNTGVYSQDRLKELFEETSLLFYGETEVAFFEDYSLEEVIEISRKNKERNQQLEEYEKAKQEFLKLGIVNKHIK
ncbi:MAG: hypothetical protein ACK5MV_00165 [Aminipila sp.]